MCLFQLVNDPKKVLFTNLMCEGISHRLVIVIRKSLSELGNKSGEDGKMPDEIGGLCPG